MLYSVRLAGIGTELPATIRTSSACDAAYGWPDGTVEAATGVRERRVAATSTIAMAAAAVRAALRDAGCGLDDVDALISASAVAHQAIPCDAVLVKEALGATGSGMPAFGVNATCLGFLLALDTAGALIACGRYKRVVVVCADKPSVALSWDDPKVSGLFGDGAAAIVLERATTPDRGILALELETYAEGAHACVIRAGGTGVLLQEQGADALRAASYFAMDGTLAYRIAAEHLPALVDRVLARAGLRMDEIDLVVPHQASASAIALTARRLNVPRGRMLDILAEHGNQVSASLPTALAWARAHELVGDGSRVLLLGSAAGITLGAAVWSL